MNGTILGIVDKRIVYQNNSTKPNRNIFVVGGPGSYKTQSVVITNLFNETENSIVVTDPKGELYEKTAGIKLAQGYQVHVVNFANMAHSDRYNPFDYIQRDIQAETVATKIVQSENAEGKKDVWFSTQRQLLKALILFVMNHRAPDQRNLAGVTQVLQENDVEAEEKGADSPLDTLFLDLTMTDPARRAYELGFKKAKGEMKASIIESLLATISKFVDKEVANFTSFSDFDLKEIGKAKVVLYVIIPVMDNTYESFINLFFSQLFDELYKLAADHHAKLPHQVDFILDEFVNLGKFPKYEEFLATCRGYGIGVTTICQTLTQLQALYGKDKAESILGNHAVKICLNAANDVTAKYFSDLLGKSTVKVETGSESTSHSKEESHSKSDSYSYTSRSLMTPDEIMRMPEDQSLLIFSNARPVKATKAFQFKLFPGADHLVNLSQNEYQGQPEASQETNFKNKVEKWKAKLKETAQKEVSNKMSQKEEEQQQDNLDSDLERVSNKDSQTEAPEEDDNNLFG
ncbi:VirD4-like conjugal transfer protein, CD1115 family [Lactiplantibacillus pentosus]|uniref:VirD4-like conjugal transfer protein, CD1115 family n=1 Tax=Lactiplantibacillus pentosus TaxID=1589 RepID=UPI003D17191A